jgi:predicted dehydrogenase
MRAAFSFTLGRPGDVRFSADLDGGALMDVGCYCVSGMRLVAGEPERVAAEQVLGGDGVDVRLAAALRFPGDVVGHFDCAFDSARRAALEIVGEEGTLYLADPWSCRNPGIELRRGDGDVEHVDIAESDPYAWELRDLAAAAAGERPALLGRADALGQARAIAALYESAAHGRAVAP